MHVRASMCRGMPVVDDGTQEVVAFLGDPVLDPDTGNIQGFFVIGAFSRHTLFLQTVDIIGWGMQVHIRGEDRLAPPEDLVRIRLLLSDGRTILGQPIRTHESNVTLGRCDDIQFNTHHFTSEWLFPRRFFLYRQPVPVTEIVEVTPDAVFVNDPLRPTKAVRRKQEREEDVRVAEVITPA
ncbi:MAG: hypothetical protein PHZ00_00315 [Candidatus Peribacteraceae bacterium]|nr:hypothetical protein [Candidatus Peribacteraceae bacterium]